MDFTNAPARVYELCELVVSEAIKYIPTSTRYSWGIQHKAQANVAQ